MRQLLRSTARELMQKSRFSIFLLASALMTLCLQTNSVYGQAFKVITIKGKIVDAATKEALAGASISIKGSTKGTTADATGQYSISISSENTVLEFKFVGYTQSNSTVYTDLIRTKPSYISSSEI